jgi:L-ascorbate metabolism protein UlaG (beta-lactamase superfamily)
MRQALSEDQLTAYVGLANGYVLMFTNGLVVYLSGDTAMYGDMDTILRQFYGVRLAVVNMGAFAMQSEESAFAVNELIRPAAVIPSHVNEAATRGGVLLPGSKTEQFVRLVRASSVVHLPLSGRTMEFDGAGLCARGC